MRPRDWAAYLIGRITDPVREELLEFAFPELDFLGRAEFKGREFGWVPGDVKNRATGHVGPFYAYVNAFPGGDLRVHLLQGDDAVAFLGARRAPSPGWLDRRLTIVVQVEELEYLLEKHHVPFSREEAEDIEEQFGDKRAGRGDSESSERDGEDAQET